MENKDKVSRWVEYIESLNKGDAVVDYIEH